MSRPTGSSAHCCDRMSYWATFSCDVHESAFDCPDAIIIFSGPGQYGLIIHDGGSSSISINYCPWCGATLDGMNGNAVGKSQTK